jgi:hypothetical protein
MMVSSQVVLAVVVVGQRLSLLTLSLLHIVPVAEVAAVLDLDLVLIMVH